MTDTSPSTNSRNTPSAGGAAGGGAYGLGLIGAAVYYITAASSFWDGAWGLVKALFWPAFLVYELMQSLNM